MRDPGNTTVCIWFTTSKRALSKMKTAVLLVAAIAVATAFDFPEEWEAWKVVSPYALCMCVSRLVGLSA